MKLPIKEIPTIPLSLIQKTSVRPRAILDVCVQHQQVFKVVKSQVSISRFSQNFSSRTAYIQCFGSSPHYGGLLQEKKPFYSNYYCTAPVQRNLSLSASHYSLKKVQNSYSNLMRKGEDYLRKNHPSAWKYVDIMSTGGRYEWSIVKLYWQNKQKQKDNPNVFISYRDAMKMHEVERNAWKMAILAPFLVLPFGYFVIAFSIYFCPNLVLPRSFWTAGQRRTFLTQLDYRRKMDAGVILHHLNYHRLNHADPALRDVLEDICATMQAGNVPSNSSLLKLKPFCQQSPFRIDEMPQVLLRPFALVLSVFPYLPRFWLTQRMHMKCNAILQLDTKMRQQNVLATNLTGKELEDATYMRSLNGVNLSKQANAYWLRNWINLTSNCSENDACFALHAMVLLSQNYSELKYQRRVFG